MLHPQFKTTCASCGINLFVSKQEKERLERKGHPPLCFDCKSIETVPVRAGDLYSFDFDLSGNGGFQQRLPIEALTGVSGQGIE